MSNKKRKILFILFIAAFFVITPLVMLYAAGYKLDTASGFVKKTGLLNLDTEPKGARIFIDNELKTEVSFARLVNRARPITTPAKIKNLLPGDYTIKLQLEGYWDWERKISVNSGQAVNLENISLVKKDLPLISAGSDVSRAELSPDRSRILYFDGLGANIFNPSDGSSIRLTDKILSASGIWSTDASQIVIGSTLYKTAEAGLGIDLSRALGKNAKFLKFDETDADNLYFFRDNTIYRLTADRQSAAAAAKLGGSIDEFTVRGDRLYYVRRASNKVYLEIVNILSGQSLRSIELPFSLQYNFVYSPNNYLVLKDIDRGNLYFVDPEFFTPIKEDISQGGGMEWIGQESFIYSTGFEIWQENLSGRHKWLITRLSQPINDLAWHSDGKFIIFSSGNSLNLLDISGPEKKVMELAKFEKISSPVIDEKGENIYFFGTIGEKSGIYKLRIK